MDANIADRRLIFVCDDNVTRIKAVAFRVSYHKINTIKISPY
jgi:hypothetical protein